MNQKIAGYLIDEEKHWVAKLSCGHVQHVRHDPPWMEREWVTTEEGRNSHIGIELNCKLCDEMGERITKHLLAEVKATLNEAYENAGISGLCDEGQFEVAVSSLEQIDTAKVLKESLQGS